MIDQEQAGVETSVEQKIITADDLRPLLEKMKSEIVSEITTRVSHEIIRQFADIIDTKINSAVDPIRRKQNEQDERSTRHSNEYKRLAEQLVAQEDMNKKIMAMLEATAEQIKQSSTVTDALVQANKTAQENYLKMVEFQQREIEQNRTMINKTDDRMQQLTETNLTFRRSVNDALANMVKAADSTKTEVGELSKQFEEIHEVSRRINIVASLFDSRMRRWVAGLGGAAAGGLMLVDAIRGIIGG